MGKQLDDNLHKGHRERMRKEFIKNGFNQNTPPHKILELLLFYSIPRKDTNEIAHRLLNRFGSISALLDASSEEIMAVEGVGENTVALIKLIMPIARQYMIEKGDNTRIIKSIEEICDFITRKYIGLAEETFGVTSFSANGTILGFDYINSGDLASVQVPMRKLIETVISRKAACVIISHNHPNGNALPSNSDIESTIKIKSLLESINVKLLDHVIVSDGDCITFSQTPSLRYIFK